MKEKLKKQMDDNIGDMLEKLIETNNGENSLIVFLNKPYSMNTSVAVDFADIYSLGVTNQGPKIKEDIFRQLTKDQKIKELKAIFDSVATLMGAMDKLLTGLEVFATHIGKRLLELDKDFDFKD